MTGIINEMRRVVNEVLEDEEVSIDVVFALVANFGGERLYLPVNDYEKRNDELYELYQNGASVRQLAMRARLSECSVRRILKHISEKKCKKNRE